MFLCFCNTSVEPRAFAVSYIPSPFYFSVVLFLVLVFFLIKGLAESTRVLVGLGRYSVRSVRPDYILLWKQNESLVSSISK